MSFKDASSQRSSGGSQRTSTDSQRARKVAHTVVGGLFKHAAEQQAAPRFSGGESPSASSSNPNTPQAVLSTAPLTGDAQSAPDRLSGSRGSGGSQGISNDPLRATILPEGFTPPEEVPRATILPEGFTPPEEVEVKPKVLSFAHDVGKEDETMEIPAAAMGLPGRAGHRQTMPYEYDPCRKSEMWNNHIPTDADGEPIRGSNQSSGSFGGAMSKFFRKVSGGIYEDELRRSNGAVYNGMVKNKLATGDGTQKWPNGAVYTGAWEEDHMHGFGKLTTPDGAVYSGQFVYNKQQGEGTYTDANGGVYQGSWHQGKMQGKGKFQWADGPCYEGEFDQGERTGYGFLAYTNGARHEGNWLNGRQHGEGVFIDPHNIKRKGIWQHGERTQWLDGQDQYSLPKGALTFEIDPPPFKAEISAAQRPSSFGPPHQDRCSDRCTQSCSVM